MNIKEYDYIEYRHTSLDFMERKLDVLKDKE